MENLTIESKATAEMTVKIMYRNSWFGGDGWTYYPVTVVIPNKCPICGGPRGEVKMNRYCEDGEFYYLSNWSNPCGHEDSYKQVFEEAAAYAARKEGQNEA